MDKNACFLRKSEVPNGTNLEKEDIMMIFGWNPMDKWNKLNKKGKLFAVAVAIIVVVAIFTGIK